MVRFAYILSLSVLLIPVLGNGCSRKPPAATQNRPLPVVASVFPLADMTRQIGGRHVRVATLVPPGICGHDFQPKSKQAEDIAIAKLMVVMGLGLDDWAIQLAEKNAVHPPAVLELARLAHLPPASSASAAPSQPTEAGRPHEDGDPHLWMDPVYMQAFAGLVADQLIDLDPAHRADYEKNRDAYLAQLTQLDADYRATLGPLKHRQIVTFHEAFSHLARRYGLQQMALENADAASFGPAQLEQVTQFVRQNHVKAIFVEPQFPADKLQELARASGATTRTIDPIGNPGVIGYDSYLAMMRSNLQVLAEALKD